MLFRSEFSERIVGDASVHRAQRVRTPWFPMGLKTLCLTPMHFVSGPSVMDVTHLLRVHYKHWLALFLNYLHAKRLS